jgi:transcriptional regulator with XRE-family HTH domain
VARRPVTSFEFARVFGNSLAKFLAEKQLSQSKAAQMLGIGRAKLNTYCHDSPRGGRCKPDAEFLYQVCVKLGFQFDYNGFRVSASTFAGDLVKQIDSPPEQLQLVFERQFDLTDETGSLIVSFKRPAGRVEMSVSLKAASR